MDTVELDKLHWTQDLPPLRRQKTQEVRRKLAYKGWIGVRVELWHLYPEPKLRPFCSLELEKHLLLTFLAP